MRRAPKPMLADDLAWAIRIAFFSENRCISMRHVLIELAAGSGLDAPQFEQDFDSGVCKLMTVAEARAGWETSECRAARVGYFLMDRSIRILGCLRST